ncbi:hypothetical protein GCM10009733_007890 [Nonomuraea maheshkhaliensis]|uniref:PASTA domain-containing protein n=1 Tax=Nonomuraea maheshkhaliensis TaxID=419590 RepID=A0ABP4QK38_9ACTN
MATADEPQDVDPYEVVEQARAALDEAGIVFPSLGVDGGSPSPGLVNFGRVHPDVALRLVMALRRGSGPGTVGRGNSPPEVNSAPVPQADSTSSAAGSPASRQRDALEK